MGLSSRNYSAHCLRVTVRELTAIQVATVIYIGANSSYRPGDYSFLIQSTIENIRIKYLAFGSVALLFLPLLFCSWFEQPPPH